MNAAGAVGCFHCGEPVPGGSRFGAVIDGAPRPMCCAGCAAVAQTISDNGLSAYYASRSELPQRELATSAPPRDLAVYDIDEVQKPFVRTGEGGVKQATLLLEGITCGACAWLIESRLGRLDGVRSAGVNLAARRVQVEWDAGRTRLSSILQAIAALGYRTQGFDAADERIRGDARAPRHALAAVRGRPLHDAGDDVRGAGLPRRTAT